jgi:hypothetical protein
MLFFDRHKVIYFLAITAPSSYLIMIVTKKEENLINKIHIPHLWLKMYVLFEISSIVL